MAAQPRRWLLWAGLGIAAAALVIAMVRGRRDDRAVEESPSTAGRLNASAPADAGSAGGRGRSSEAELMARLRRIVDARPGEALDLLRRSESRFPSSPLADERAWIGMRALVHLGQIAAARDRATRFFRRFPASPFGERVYRLTGVHPRPRPGPR